jgi:catechol 2,3-dioxygenase
MTAVQPAPVPFVIDAATHIGAVSLRVANLRRSLDYYTRAIGLTVLEQRPLGATLGVGATPLLYLQEQPGALPWMVDNMTGLYHFAILVPTRADLGRWFRHYLPLEFSPPGQGDHIVSEALYLRDPDGHGIEIYADRPRAGWQWTDGSVRMGGGPVDVRGLLAEAAAANASWAGMPEGTYLGHMHLQVSDLTEAHDFYCGVLGFEVVAGSIDFGALFVSAGRYHHHIGMNTWHSKGFTAAPSDTVTLQAFSITLPGEQAVHAIAGRLQAAGIAYQRQGNAITTHDPCGNEVVLRTGASPITVL